MDAGQEPSLEALRHAWEAKYGLFGEEDPETLEAAVELATAQRRVGQPAPALKLLESVVTSRRVTLGTADLKTIQAETLLAFVLADLGELKRAQSIQTDVLQRCNEQFGWQSEQSVGNAACAWLGLVVWL